VSEYETVVELVPAVIFDGAGGWFANPGTGDEAREAGFTLPFDLDPGDPENVPCHAEHDLTGYYCDRGPKQDHTWHVATDGTYVLARWAR